MSTTTKDFVPIALAPEEEYGTLKTKNFVPVALAPEDEQGSSLPEMPKRVFIKEKNAAITFPAGTDDATISKVIYDQWPDLVPGASSAPEEEQGITPDYILDFLQDPAKNPNAPAIGATDAQATPEELRQSFVQQLEGEFVRLADAMNPKPELSPFQRGFGEGFDESTVSKIGTATLFPHKAPTEVEAAIDQINNPPATGFSADVGRGIGTFVGDIPALFGLGGMTQGAGEAIASRLPMSKDVARYVAHALSGAGLLGGLGGAGTAAQNVVEDKPILEGMPAAVGGGALAGAAMGVGGQAGKDVAGQITKQALAQMLGHNLGGSAGLIAGNSAATGELPTPESAARDILVNLAIGAQEGITPKAGPVADSAPMARTRTGPAPGVPSPVETALAGMSPRQAGVEMPVAQPRVVERPVAEPVEPVVEPVRPVEPVVESMRPVEAPQGTQQDAPESTRPVSEPIRAPEPEIVQPAPTDAQPSPVEPSLSAGATGLLDLLKQNPDNLFNVKTLRKVHGDASVDELMTGGYLSLPKSKNAKGGFSRLMDPTATPEPEAQKPKRQQASRASGDPLTEFRKYVRQVGVNMGRFTEEDFGGKFPVGYVRKNGGQPWDALAQEAPPGLLPKNPTPDQFRALFTGKSVTADTGDVSLGYDEGMLDAQTAPRTTPETEMAPGDLVKANGEWYRVEPGEDGGKVLKDGERIELSDADAVLAEQHITPDMGTVYTDAQVRFRRQEEVRKQMPDYRPKGAEVVRSQEMPEESGRVDDDGFDWSTGEFAGKGAKPNTDLFGNELPDPEPVRGRDVTGDMGFEGQPAPRPIDTTTQTDITEFAKPMKTGPQNRNVVPRGNYEPAHMGAAELPLREPRTDSRNAPTPTRIVQALERDLGVPIRTGRLGKSANGIYRMLSKVIRVRVANRLPTIAHEAGHHLQRLLFGGDATRMNFPPEHAVEIRKLAYPGAKDKTMEGFAEFVRLRLTDPESAAAKAPAFNPRFDAELDRHPAIKATLERARQDIARWMERPAEAKVLATMSVNGRTPRRRGLPGRLYRQWLDEYSPIEKATRELANGATVPAAKDPFKLAWLSRGASGKAEAWLVHGRTDAAGVKVGKSLREITQPLHRAGELDAFRAYLVARHGIDVIDTLGPNAMPLPKREYETVVSAAPKHFEGHAADLAEYQRALLEDMAQAGLMDRQTVERLQDKWPHYIPLNRTQETNGRAELEASARTSKGMGNLTSPLRRIKGSGRDIIDPLESIVAHTYRFMDLSARGRVMQALYDLSREGAFRAPNDKSPGRLVEEVPIARTPVATVSMRELLSNRMAEGLGIEPGLLDEIQATIFRPSTRVPGSENIVSVYKDGREHWLKLEPELYNAVTRADAASANIVISLLGAPARALRLGATTTLEFGVRNPLKDITTAMVNSNYGFTPVDFLRGLFSAVRKDGLYYKWLSSGGGRAALVSADRKYLQETLRNLQGRTPTEGVIDLVRHPIDALRAFTEFTETATRLGEFGKGTRWGRETDPNRVAEAALSSRDVTLDFSRMGTYGREVNKVKAFFNASLQGTDKTVRMFRVHPVRTTVRAAAYITAPTVMLYLLNRNDERYRRLPEWEKDAFWIIPTAEYQIRIPKPHLMGYLFGSLPERALRYIDQEDPTAFDRFAHDLWTQVSPGSPLPTAFQGIVDVWANKSFSGAPIVPMREEDLPPEQQYGEDTTGAAKLVGDLTGQSPRQIDYLAQSYGGGLGRYGMQALGAATEATGLTESAPDAAPLLSDLPLAQGLTVNKWAASADVRRFYEEKESLEQKKAGAKKDGPAISGRERVRLLRLNAIDRRMKRVREQRRAVESSERMTPVEKRDKLLRLRQQEDDLAASVYQ